MAVDFFCEAEERFLRSKENASEFDEIPVDCRLIKEEEIMATKRNKFSQASNSMQPWRTLDQLGDLWGTSCERTQRLAAWLVTTGRLEVRGDGARDPSALFRLPKEYASR